MSITFSGMASGMPVDDIITQLMAIERAPINLMEQKKADLKTSKTYLDNVESRVKKLDSAIQTLTDGNITSNMDLFQKKTAASADTTILTATAKSKAVNQNFTVNVLNVATSTKLSSLGAAASGNVGALATGATTIEQLSNGAGKSGTFTVFYNDTPYEITVNSGDDINTILGNIGAATGGNITGSVAGGIVTLQSAGGVITVGANGDTSNFLSATQLDVGTFVGNDLQSANPITAISTGGALVGNAANLQTAVTAGTFTIGTQQFTVDATTTIDSLLSKINNSPNANVSASYNLRTNKFEFISKDPGKKAITLGAAGDTSNFLSAINVINGADTLAYQQLGNNAKIQINGGSVIESTSNTITDSVTGLKDVTLTLLKDSAGKEINVNVKNDTDGLVSAIENFVSQFNSVISYIDQETKSETGHLPSDSTLVRLRNNLRMKVTDMVANSNLVSLASVGITTGNVGSEGDPSAALKFDKTKFLEKLGESPEDVRALFIGDTDNSVTGIMQTLETYTNYAIDPVEGLFFTKDDAIDRQIKTLDSSITRAEERLTKQEELLRAQFAAMESAISTMQSQSSYISSIGN